jgi:hypothetical protein
MALMHFIHMIWRIRNTFPWIDILLHADGIDAAFRHIIYSPGLTIVFAFIFEQYLIVPAGRVFGSRSAPSFFSLLSDLSADVATTSNVHEEYPLHPLATNMSLTAALRPEDLTPAVADFLSPPLDPEE